jgi:hypothetical protein
VGWFDGENYLVFESSPKQPQVKNGALDLWLRWLFSGEAPSGPLYAHNGGNFDANFVLKWLLKQPKRRYRWQIIPVQSTTLCLEVWKEGSEGSWRFLDSARLMPASLEKLGKTFGLGGKVPDVDYATLHLDPRRYEYLERDCRLLYVCIERFRTMIEGLGGEVGMTAPSTAMATYRRAFQRVPLQTHVKSHKLAREAYYGGRTEVFRRKFDGPGMLCYGDVNSMYPWAMCGDAPVGDATTIRGSCDWEYLSRCRAGIVEATVYVPESSYVPPLPVRHGGKLVFPVGTFKGAWHADELRCLLECGGSVVKQHRSVWYSTADAFTGFVEALYLYRDKSRLGYDEGLAFIAKLLLNSFYGKFGTQTERQMILGGFPDNAEGRRLTPFDPDNDIWTEATECHASYIIPQVAGWVTARARARLWRALYQVHRSGGDLYYCDTDSIISTHDWGNATKLGEIKRECWITQADFAAPKLYLYETPEGVKVRAKGFSRFGGSQVTPDQYRALTGGEAYQASRLGKAKALLRGADCGVVEVTKRLREAYSKRILLDCGNTKPIMIGQEQHGKTDPGDSELPF